MSTSQELSERFRTALEALVNAVNKGGRGDSLLGIGIVTADGVEAISSALLFAGDLPDGSPAYQRLSPVEWPQSHEAAFVELNQYLKSIFPSGESDEEYRTRVSLIFDACATTMQRLDLRQEFPRLDFLTFAGVDPDSVLEAAEEEFVRRMNSPEVFDEWRNEFAY